MKLCILGPEKRTESDIKLIDDAKKEFETVLYVPYSNISLSITEKMKVFYKTDISKFDAILPRIPRSRSLFGYILFDLLKVYTPIKSQAYFITSDRFLMMDILKREGISVPKIYFVDSVNTATKLIDKIEYPFSLKVSDEKGITFANTRKEAKTVLDTLGSFKKPIYMEEFFKEKYYQAFVIGNKVVAALERKPSEKSDIFYGRGKLSKTNLPNDMKNLAVSASSSVKTDFAMVEMVKKPKKCVININLNPAILNAIKITKINIGKQIINYVHSYGSLSKKPELSWIKSFFDDIKTRVKI